MSRHGLRLLAVAKSWSDTNELAEEMVPPHGGCDPPTGTSSAGIPSKTTAIVVDHPPSRGTRWSTVWSTVTCGPHEFAAMRLHHDKDLLQPDTAEVAATNARGWGLCHHRGEARTPSL